MKSVLKVIRVMLFLSAGANVTTSTYTVRVTNMADKPVSTKLNVISAFCKDQRQLIAPGQTASFGTNCFTRQIEVTYPDKTMKAAKPIKKDDNSVFLIELNQTGDDIIITAFSPSQTGPGSLFAQRVVQAQEKVLIKRNHDEKINRLKRERDEKLNQTRIDSGLNQNFGDDKGAYWSGLQ